MTIKNLLVDMAAIIHKDGRVTPVKFKYEDKYIDVELIQSDVNRKTGDITYKCFSIVENFKWHYILRFERDDCKWYLSSMD